MSRYPGIEVKAFKNVIPGRDPESRKAVPVKAIKANLPSLDRLWTGRAGRPPDKGKKEGPDPTGVPMAMNCGQLTALRQVPKWLSTSGQGPATGSTEWSLIRIW